VTAGEGGKPLLYAQKQGEARERGGASVSMATVPIESPENQSIPGNMATSV
jgi:hypothetical protein